MTIRNDRFNEIGLACLDPQWAGGRPDEPDGVIAKRANCSTGHVRKVREELVRGGKLRKAA